MEIQRFHWFQLIENLQKEPFCNLVFVFKSLSNVSWDIGNHPHPHKHIKHLQNCSQFSSRPLWDLLGASHWMTGENEYSPLMTRISRRGGVPPPYPVRISSKIFRLRRNFPKNFSPSAKCSECLMTGQTPKNPLMTRISRRGGTPPLPNNSEDFLNDQDEVHIRNHQVH